MTAILVTGGTGSFGQAFVRHELAHGPHDRIIVFSRDELKQSEMRLAGLVDERLRYFLGDVRDLSRLRRAFRGVGTVVHAAALKQVDSAEYNPLEAVKTNVYGTENVIEAALDCGVRRVMFISSDKAVDPVNLYGSTKQTAERLVVDANVYGGDDTLFSCVRYGNVLTSRGSVLNRFLGQQQAGVALTVTDPKMTRFVLTIDQAVQFVAGCLTRMGGGEVFVPRLPAVDVATIAGAVCWPGDPQWELVKRRPGEKTHEVLVSRHESPRTSELDDHFVVHPITLGVDSLQTLWFSSEFAERLSIGGFRVLAGLEVGVAV